MQRFLAQLGAFTALVLAPVLVGAQPAPVAAPVPVPVTVVQAPASSPGVPPAAVPPAPPMVPATASPLAVPPVQPMQPVAQPTAAAPGAMVAIRDIDREMSALSGDITQSHTRLQQITSMVLEQTGGGAQLIVEHQNDMGSTFRLMRATYSLDGAIIATRTDDNGSLADQSSFAVYNGSVSSGDHNLTVSLEYQGNGYGIFSYIRGYTFRARSVQAFSVPEGRALRLVVVGYERGGATSAIEERPAIRYAQNTMTLREAQALTQRTNAPTAATPGVVPGTVPGGAQPASAASGAGTGATP